MIKVTKFGGSSLASAEQFKKVAGIVKSDKDRRFVVASAPGKRNAADTKVTDMLYKCCEQARNGENFEETLARIRERFAEIISQLGIEFDLESEFDDICKNLSKPRSDYMASRGEHLNAKILARYLGFEFIEAADCVRFDENGKYMQEESNLLLAQRLEGVEYAVIPGFYGAKADGTIKTFSRGGSDITGSIVARAVRADIYENWTDVSGVAAADPRIVENPRMIDYITYRELRELSYMGASVLHEDAVFPVRREGIPINICNTNCPEAKGTMIVSAVPQGAKRHTVTGIAGRKGFSTVFVEKAMMNAETGFGAALLTIFADNGVSFEHAPSGIDTMSVVVSSEDFNKSREKIIAEIQTRLKPDNVTAEDGIALIAVVGHGMASAKGIAAKICSAIAKSGTNIRMIDQGPSELNIIFGIDAENYEAAIRGIYEEIKNLD